MPDGLVLAIDQGTSSTKCLLAAADGQVVASGSAPVPIRYPRPGWVEQDAIEILDSVLAAAAACLEGIDRSAVVAVGFSTQRESALIWDRHTGAPLGPVLGWQDQRAVGVCDKLRGDEARIRAISGLPLDPMFSAAKLRWLLDGTPGALVGTIDSWLLYALTGSHQIEVGNASRTQLLDVRSQNWSPELLGLFGIPSTALPEITPSQGELGRIGERGGVLAGLPITAVLGDSHAALYAHGSEADDGVKVTYGTGSSVMRLGAPASGDVCLTVAWNDRLAAEGNIRSSGATVAWLASFLSLSPEQIGQMAATAESDGVFLVPGFGGLAAPWWDDTAVGLISGLTLGTRPPQLARAAVESIAHQVADVVDAMGGASRVLADGGASGNDVLMRIQADLLGVPVKRARTSSLSALGAASLAGGLTPAVTYDEFVPSGDATASRSAWRDAVRRALSSKESR
ncbi:FGGY family carbohydrate kinase [Paractinoplanes atraurantiacus]|uniref:ATP:glycerol 3-phosphotransferase n=1 Tax=Paractinoplanes atraurantiacus TaxID=1036182 RepID=A0A285KCV8_9ACTN|nr:FGGY family carbohydrate kinase [Actinoplanes atraurantiacus]SNY70408.1 glycerol kinase [Actinoplanes atraurantiacus]